MVVSLVFRVLCYPDGSENSEFPQGYDVVLPELQRRTFVRKIAGAEFPASATPKLQENCDMASDAYDAGLIVRRQVLGSEYVDKSINNADEFTKKLQDFVTEHAWGTVWQDDTIDQKTRSMINVALWRVYPAMKNFGCICVEPLTMALVRRRSLRFCYISAFLLPVHPARLVGSRSRRKYFLNMTAVTNRRNGSVSARYGYVGIGNMGGPMAANLAQTGSEVIIGDLNTAAVEAFTTSIKLLGPRMGLRR